MTRPVLVDTSALYAIHDADDAHHRDAARRWDLLLSALERGEASACTHPYVLVETTALVQRRLGISALRDLHGATLPVVEVVWIDEGLHRRAESALLAAGRRDLSLVDWTSFELMRDRGIEHALAFDADFAAQGFSLWP